MELDELLRRLDRVSANVERLDQVWERVSPLIPTSPAAGAPPEYDDLARQWAELRSACPPIDGFQITADIPDYDSHGLGFIDLDVMESMPLFQEGERPGKELGEYKFRLGRTRRRAIRSRLGKLTSECEGLLINIATVTTGDESTYIESDDTQAFQRNVAEIEQLLGDTVRRSHRWGDLHRHMHFSQKQDWEDIRTMDWPDVREDLEASGLAELDPIEVPMEDLAQLASAPTGPLRVGLAWDAITDGQFESLLFDLLRAYEGHKNVLRLTNTNAPDRGRDLSLDRHIAIPGGQTRVERVMVQAKHWRSKSVSISDLTALIAQAETWTVPFQVVIVATTGTFTSDAGAYAEARNQKGDIPRVELWPSSTLESMLSEFPHIAVSYGLR